MSQFPCCAKYVSLQLGTQAELVPREILCPSTHLAKNTRVLNIRVMIHINQVLEQYSFLPSLS